MRNWVDLVGVYPAVLAYDDHLAAAAASAVGAGRTLEIQTPEDWADLCREYPMRSPPPDDTTGSELPGVTVGG